MILGTRNGFTTDKEDGLCNNAPQQGAYAIAGLGVAL